MTWGDNYDILSSDLQSTASITRSVYSEVLSYPRTWMWESLCLDMQPKISKVELFVQQMTPLLKFSTCGAEFHNTP